MAFRTTHLQAAVFALACASAAAPSQAQAPALSALENSAIERRATEALIWTATGSRPIRRASFELMFRAYAPTKALFEKTWVLPDVERARRAARHSSTSTSTRLRSCPLRRVAYRALSGLPVHTTVGVARRLSAV